jgi:ribosomal protein L40E
MARQSLLFVSLVAALLVVAGSASAQVCVKCVARNCTEAGGNGFVNCASNGEKCFQWVSCSPGGSPVASLSVVAPIRVADAGEWRLVSTEVHAARVHDPEWRLASVSITPVTSPETSQ